MDVETLCWSHGLSPTATCCPSVGVVIDDFPALALESATLSPWSSRYTCGFNSKKNRGKSKFVIEMLTEICHWKKQGLV